MSKRIATAVILTAAVMAAACGDTARSGDSDPDGLSIVATTSILGDVLRNIVGDDAAVSVLIPIGADPHDYQPSARQVAAVAEADLVVANGLALEETLNDVLESAIGDGANILEIGGRLDPIERPGAAGEWDPHVWLDPLRMAEGVGVIGAELDRLDSGVDWSTRAAAYADELRDLHVSIEDVLARVAPADRLLVTNHESLGYFADRYGFEIAGVVIPGGSSLAAPSAGDLAALVEVMVDRSVPAIFTESTDSIVLAESVASEAGGEIAVVEIYTGSLGESGSGAETLLGLLLTNARRIAAALS
jgi:zinc/manganese transport system substrate-binding protein